MTLTKGDLVVESTSTVSDTKLHQEATMKNKGQQIATVTGDLTAFDCKQLEAKKAELAKAAPASPAKPPAREVRAHRAGRAPSKCARLRSARTARGAWSSARSQTGPSDGSRARDRRAWRPTRSWRIAKRVRV